MILRAGLLWVALAGAAGAVELTLPPTARLSAERDTAADRYLAPVSVFQDGAIETLTLDGDIARAAWRIDLPGLSPLQVLAPLRAQLAAEGFRILLDCGAAACGGFDFRFATEVLPGPNMYVNIRAYHYLTAATGPADAPDQVVTLLASTSAASAYVQIIQATAAGPAGIGSPDPVQPSLATPNAPVSTSGTADISDLLRTQGHLVLRGLDFDSGTAVLGTQNGTLLGALADFMAQNPQARIALVGHTDNVGSLDANIALSRARAQSVRQALIDTYEIAPNRIEAQGVGYLAPATSNQTAAGRDANRRVEVVILSP